jgi:hypothetical protein
VTIIGGGVAHCEKVEEATVMGAREVMTTSWRRSQKIWGRIHMGRGIYSAKKYQHKEYVRTIADNFNTF